jgi:hypothetical protein
MTLKTMLITPSNGKNICHDNPELMYGFIAPSLTKNWKGRGKKGPCLNNIWLRHILKSNKAKASSFAVLLLFT